MNNFDVIIHDSFVIGFSFSFVLFVISYGANTLLSVFKKF